MTELIPAFLVDNDDVDRVQQLIDAEAAAVEDTGVVTPRWRIDGINTADWAMRHYRGATKQLDGIHEQAEAFRDELRAKLARVDAWEEEVSARPRRTIEFFTYHLESYAMAVRRETDGKIKTIALPSGKVTTREAAAPVAEFVDKAAEEIVLRWVKTEMPKVDQERIIKTTEKVLISELRTCLRIAPASDEPDAPLVVIGPHGEPVPGLAVRHPEITASVKPD